MKWPKPPRESRKVVITADSFCETLSCNIDNDKLSDKAFRQMCRNTLPSVVSKESK